MTTKEFAQLAQEMRELGATHVKAGDWEVSFPFPVLDTQDPMPTSTPADEVRYWLKEQYGSSV